MKNPVTRMLTDFIRMGLIILVLVGCAQNPIYSRVTGGGGEFGRAWTVQGKCQVVHQWVNRFEQEFPKTFVMAGTKMYVGRGELDAKIGNLYRDEYFIPVFGKPFDQMSEKERNSLYNSISPSCFHAGQYKDAWDLKAFGGMIQLIMYEKGVSNFVTQARKTNQWKEQTLSEIQALPASEETFSQIAKAREYGKQTMADFWLGEQQTFMESLQSGLRRISEGVIMARIDKALSGPSTYEGLKQFQQVVIDDRDGLFDLMPSDVKTREEERAAQIFQEGLKTVLAEEWKHFEARGTGLAGVKNGAHWYNDFEERYFGTITLGPQGDALLKEFQAQRQLDLSSAQKDLKVVVNRAQTLEDLNAFAEEYLVSTDGVGLGAKPVFELILTRKVALNFEKEKWQYSQGELALMATPGRITIPDSYEAPRSDDIRMALLRSFVNAGGRLVDAYTATFVTATLEDMLPGGAFGTAPIPGFGRVALPRLPHMPLAKVHVRTVRIDECLAAKGGGYTCRYSAEFDLRNFAGNLLVPQGNIDEFVLTDDGWESRSANHRIADASTRATGKIMEDIGSAMPRPGCMGRQALSNPNCRR